MGATEEKVARFIVETRDDEISPPVLRMAKLNCFDCVGVMLAGVASDPGKIMTRYMKEAGGTSESTIVGTGLRTSPALAALANGSFAHALDYDDMGAGWGHPTCVLLPPLISLGERMGISGKDLLHAYVIGLRVGMAINSACTNYLQQERGFHGTSIFGVFAATAACARLLKLNVEQTMMALGTAGSMGGGLLQNIGCYTKGLHAGLADHNAVLACLLAQDGWTGTEKVFESKLGFFVSYAGRDMYSLETVQNLLDKRPIAIEATIKKYPCCGGIHSSLDSLISLLRENNINFDDIERVDVYGTPYGHHILFYPEPANGFQGKFSLHYSLATAMIDKLVDIDSYSDEKLKRPQFREAMKKLTVHLVSPWDPNYKAKSFDNTVNITLKNGRTFSRTTKVATMRGTQANPLTDEELVAKFRANAALALPHSAVERACEAWWNLDKVGNIGEALETIAGKVAVKA